MAKFCYLLRRNRYPLSTKFCELQSWSGNAIHQVFQLKFYASNQVNFRWNGVSLFETLDLKMQNIYFTVDNDIFRWNRRINRNWRCTRFPNSKDLHIYSIFPVLTASFPFFVSFWRPRRSIYVDAKTVKWNALIYLNEYGAEYEENAAFYLFIFYEPFWTETRHIYGGYWKQYVRCKRLLLYRILWELI